MGDDKSCICSEKHARHICMLKIRGKAHEIKNVTSTPNVACVKCGEEANSEDDVCAPVPLFI